MTKGLKVLQIIALFLFFTFSSSAKLRFVKNGEFYLSWGYNTESYSKSNLYIDQPSLKSNYVFQDVQGRDHIGWDKLFVRALSIPQYNYRIGYFFNEKQDWGLEINFDHTKYIVNSGQTVIVKGTRNGLPVNSPVLITDNVLIYYLNNGANFFLLNLVKKINILSSASGNFKLCALLKAGVGPVVPHVENVIFGDRNHAHFQVGGWNTGTEATIKMTFYKHVYLEFCNKFDYARYSRLGIYEGLAHQSFFTYEIIGNLGYSFSCGKKKKPVTEIAPGQ